MQLANPRTLLVALIALCFSHIGQAQDVKREIPSGTNVSYLLELSDSLSRVRAKQKAEAEEFARKNNLPIRIETDSTTIEIIRIENGQPLYYETDNLTAAYSLNTDDLWTGGSLGIDIQGEGMIIGEWDGGAVLSTHVEFNPTIGASRAIQQDGASSANYHATHVAGTLIGEGENSSARGMANKATLHAYDWFSDDSEMASEAASGLLVSNHSYGFISGWRYNSSSARWEWWGNPAESEDFKFGQYSSSAAAWDNIAFNAPYYLIVKSAGNDRNDNGSDPYYINDGGWVLSTQPASFREPDGGADGFDCIGSQGTAKNVLTVGAVNDVASGWSQPSDVGMSSFSGWGPTDDGRIKPDVVGNGIGLFSAYTPNNTSYASLSGTSMSAPNVAGTLLLLQQLHDSIHGNFMRAATLKGLVIHTANEAGGNPGPDYSFGWGLVDANGAAEIIMNNGPNDIIESTLIDGNTYTLTFISDGVNEVDVTLSWTDPVGPTQAAVLNDPTLRLINDLDVVITDGTNTWEPWVLDPANPGNAATTGNNFRDNVEKIEAGILPAGTYTVEVTHKGTLQNSQQDFSIIISGKSSTPIANFSPSNQNPCPGSTVQLNDESTGTVTSYNWSISPSTGWSFVNGTNASSSNPEVVFNTMGSYDVTQTVSSSLGSDAITKTNIINVSAGSPLPYSNTLETAAERSDISFNNPDGSTTWEFASNAVNGTSLYIDNYSYSTGSGQSDFATLPELDFSSYNSVTLTFDYAYARYSSVYSDTLVVAVSTDCGTSFIDVFTGFETGSQNFATAPDQTPLFNAGTASDWCDGTPACPAIDLSAYAGQSSIQVAFINKSGYGNSLYLDNINITGTTTSNLSISGITTDADCNGASTGAIDVTIAGGQAPYAINWNTGATSEDLSNIAAGTYSVTVSDGSGQSVSQSFTVGEPSAISLTTSSTNETIAGSNDGMASVSVTGGTAGYDYMWSNSETTVSITNLSPGTYSVTVTDANGCSESASVTILTGVPVLSISGTTTDADCNGASTGAIDVTIAGGQAPYAINWNTGATSEDLSNIAAGTYSVTVSDGSGQSVSQSFTVNEPSAISLTTSSTNETIAGSNDGSASVSVTGGTAGYDYLWNNSGTTASITNLSPGTYSVTVTDANGCSESASVTISTGVPVLSISGTTTDADCNGASTGAVDLTISGGQAPYAINWNTGATSEDLSNIAAGTYSVTVSDASGQSVSQSFTVNEPTALSLSTSSTNETIAGSNDGSASVSATGGTAGYDYLWSNSETTASITNLAPGSYSVTVTDANGCSESASVTISTGAPVLSISGTTTDADCNGAPTGAIDVTIAGGQAPYAINWNTGATSEDLSNIAAGTYSVTVSDASGQSVSQSFTVNEPSTIVLTTTSTNETISGSNDGSASVSVTGGTAGYDYLWNNSGTTASITNLSPGTYSVTVTDANGCSESASVTISTGVPVLSISGTTTDADCNGAPTGAIDVTIAGGQAPYAINWNAGATSEDLSNIAAGTYSVTVSDGSGQSVSQSFTVNEPTALSLSITSTNETIAGSNDGSASVSVTGGTAGYDYLWSNSETTVSITNLSPGTYSVTVTDANGCSESASVTISTGVSVLSISGTTTDADCNGASTGAIDVTIAGGQAPYAINWNTGATSEDLSNIAAGTYSVTVSDGSGQSGNQSFTISEPSALSLSITSTNETVAGNNDGSASVSVTGGTAGYSYLWSNGQTTANINNLAPSTYSVTVTDSNVCSESASVTIATGVPVLSISGTTTDADCNGASTGAIDVTISGGQAPYAINWNTGATSEDLSNIAAGTYSVTVSDGSGQSVSQSFTVVEPSVISLTTSSTNETVAGSNDGSASVSVTGGTAGYDYLWSNGQTTANINNLAPSTYSVTVTDANGCSESASVTIATGVPVLTIAGITTDADCNGAYTGAIDVTISGGQAPYTVNWNTGATSEDLSNIAAGTYSVTVSDASGQSVSQSFTVVEPSAISLTTSSTNETIAGSNDGSASVSVTGGTPGYDYLWSNSETTASITNLSPGTYSVTVTDANGCSESVSVTVGTGVPVLTIAGTTTDVDCNGALTGAIDVTIAGGQAPYTFNWNTGATSEDLSNIAAGTYSVTVSDASGQSANQSFTISEPSALSLSITSTNETIAGSNDGSASVSVTGGTAGYDYLWSNGQTTANINNLAPSTYSVTVTDANGCSESVSVTVGTGVPVLSISGTTTDADCNGASTGAIDVTISGGQAPFAINWNTGATSEDLSNIAAGTYSVTVSDGSGQSVSQSFTVVEPSVISLTTSSTNETIAGSNDGSASASVTGGTPGYSYAWSNGATTSSIVGLSPNNYSVVVTDANGCSESASVTIATGVPVLSISGTITDADCNGAPTGVIDVTIAGGQAPYAINWNTGATSEDLSNIAAGTYSVTVSDGSGQSANQSFTVNEPTALSLSITSTNETIAGSNDGSASVSVTGGTPGYSYAWSNGATTSSIVGLSPNNYSVVVTDANGCSESASVTISTGVPVLSISGTTTDADCNGASTGAIDVTIAGGQAPYTVSWNSGATSEDLSNIAAGTYSVTVSDASGQSVSQSFTVNEPTALSLSITSTNETVAGNNDGSTSVSVTGGTADYSYLWSNGQTTANINNLAPSTYGVTVTDANGCSESVSVTVGIGVPVLSISGTTTDADCNGASTGAIDVTIAGGQAPYAINWNTGQTSEDLSNIAAGTYSVTVSDASGQSVSQSFTVGEPSAISLTTSSTNETVAGSNDGSASVSVTGGTPGYDYLWSNSETTASITNLSPGTYSVTVTDASGCSESVSVTIATGVPVLSISGTTTDADCNGSSTGAIDVTISGGQAPYTVNWNSGVTSEDLSNIAAGTYSVTVSDASGQSVSQSFTISEPSALSLSITSTDETIAGSNDGSASVSVTGGTAGYDYLWSNSETTTSITNLAPGTYSVTVTDANGCSESVSVIVGTGVPVLSISGIATDADCNGVLTGAIDVTISGGQAPFTITWSNGATTEDISGLPSGTYGVLVTDALGQVAADTFSIQEPLPLALTGLVTDPSFASTDGAIDIIISGGLAPYAMTWSDGSLDSNRSNLASGTYGLTVVDANGCAVSGSWTLVNLPPPALVDTFFFSNVRCFGGLDGSINVQLLSGVPPYQIDWSNGDTVFALSGLQAGIYSYTITDDAGQTTSNSVNITQPAQLVVTALESSPGNLYALPTGGVPPYTYNWNTVPASQDSAVTVTSGGMYIVTITDARGCVATDTVTSFLSIVENEIHIGVFPNPGNQMFNVSSSQEIATIRVTDLLGKAIYFEDNIHNSEHVVDATRWANGTYYISIRTQSATRVVKWVKYD